IRERIEGRIERADRTGHREPSTDAPGRSRGPRGATLPPAYRWLTLAGRDGRPVPVAPPQRSRALRSPRPAGALDARCALLGRGAARLAPRADRLGRGHDRAPAASRR